MITEIRCDGCGLYLGELVCTGTNSRVICPLCLAMRDQLKHAIAKDKSETDYATFQQEWNAKVQNADVVNQRHMATLWGWLVDGDADPLIGSTE